MRNWVWEEQRDFNSETLDPKAQRRGREGIALKCPDWCRPSREDCPALAGCGEMEEAS